MPSPRGAQSSLHGDGGPEGGVKRRPLRGQSFGQRPNTRSWGGRGPRRRPINSRAVSGSGAGRRHTEEGPRAGVRGRRGPHAAHSRGRAVCPWRQWPPPSETCSQPTRLALQGKPPPPRDTQGRQPRPSSGEPDSGRTHRCRWPGGCNVPIRADLHLALRHETVPGPKPGPRLSEAGAGSGRDFRS